MYFWGAHACATYVSQHHQQKAKMVQNWGKQNMYQVKNDEIDEMKRLRSCVVAIDLYCQYFLITTDRFACKKGFQGEAMQSRTRKVERHDSSFYYNR